MTYKMKPCQNCQGDEFASVPDSLASYCVKCGFVWVGVGDDARPGVSMQDWARSVYEAQENRRKEHGEGGSETASEEEAAG